MNSIPCRALLFDLDGTLVDSAPDLWRALNHVLKNRNYPELPLEQVHHLIGSGARVLLARGFWGVDAEPPEEEDDFFASAVTEFLDYYRQNLSQYSTPYPGVIETLTQLQTLKFKLGVLTNKPEKLTTPLLKQLKLDRFFSIVLGGDSLPWRKPDPRPLQHALQTWNLTEKEVIMVGDSDVDINTAKAAGSPVIALSYGYNRGLDLTALKPDILIHNFKDLLNFIAPYDDIKI
ncbi:phosphoglycolate phosphatase [Magnetococcales bacterium HHB-1]